MSAPRAGVGAARARAAARALTRRQWLAVLGIATAAVFLGNQGFRRLVSRWVELRRVRRELTVLKEEEAVLRAKLELARKGDRSLERVVRQDLGYLKPGEVEYRFPPPQKAP